LELRGEYTFSNRLVGSVGLGAEGLLYHANFTDSQVNRCPSFFCAASEQNFNVFSSSNRNGVLFGASAKAELAYSFTKNAKIVIDATYRSEFYAPTIFNKITEKNGPPYVGTGNRRWEWVGLGFSYNFGDR